MKMSIKTTLASLTLLTTFAMNVAYGAEAKAISIVKEGRLQGCLLGTVERMVDASMENPKWEHSVGKNGVDYVTVRGLIITGKPVNGALQFWVKNNTFGIQAVELDKVPQNNTQIIYVMGVMCEAIRYAKAKDKDTKQDGLAFHKNLEQVKLNLQKIYDEHKNTAKGEFESTADFNKRKEELDKKLKDNSELYFNNILNSVIANIEDYKKSFNLDLVKYDADKQIFNVVFKINDLNMNGEVKIPPEIAKNLKEDMKKFSFKYEDADLRVADNVLIPAKMSIYDINKNEYKVSFVLPKNAKEIVFNGSELWKDNPYAKDLSISLAEAMRRKTAQKTTLIKEGLTDSRDGKKYKVVNIGTQMWLANNLNYDTSDSKCYDNKPKNCEKYGRLYSWEMAMKACPAGWHLPNNAEWGKLAEVVGGTSSAGKYLKAKSGWSESGNGEDKFGFAALLGGGGYSSGRFFNVGSNGYWWSATKINASCAYLSMDHRESIYGSSDDGNDYEGNSLFSVRCLQD